MSRFRVSSAALMQITVGNVLEHEKGVYGFMYAKPSRRLAIALTADREILVLVSTFPDQQQRTVATAKFMIAESAGRLESGIAIIIHCDPRGNQKLRNWGREQGISILPVYCGAEKLPEGDDFERLLCLELYSYDPFDVTGPVADDAQFFGRRTEAQDLARKLQTGQIRACFGIRKIGKTSILNRILNDAQKHHECVCIMLDCSLDDVWSSKADRLLNGISSTIESAVANNHSYASVAGLDNSGGIIAERLLAAILSSNKPLILFIDEVDYITPGSPTGHHWKSEFNVFWRSVRAAYQESSRRSRQFSILIGGVSSKWFAVESIDGIENAALALVPEEYLSPLPRGASVAMIKRMARVAGIQFDDRTCEMIAGACSDMPFWIRKACSHIHRQLEVARRPLVPAEERVREMIADFIQNDGATIAQVALSHLFRVYPELEETCRACAAGQHSLQPLPLVRSLERYGVVDPRDNYKLSGEMIKAGFELHESKPKVPKQAEGILKTGEGHAYSEWAEDLAVISKRRNLLERQLREMVLNFFRFDSVNNKGMSVSERILRGLPSERRDKLRAFNGEALLGKLMWKELAAIVRKEWVLFQKLFGDAALFEQHVDIINDRPDSHAKPLTAADVAMYDRSLKWFEDRLLAG